MSKIVKSWTKEHVKELTCKRCNVPNIPANTSFATAPIPQDIRNLLSIKMQEKVKRDCSSGGGLNTGPLPPLPPVPLNGEMDGELREENIKAHTQCTYDWQNQPGGSYCGMRCGQRQRVRIETNPATPFCVARPVNVDKVESRNSTCFTARKIGAGNARSINIKYKARYCIYSFCSSGCVEEFFFVPRIVNTTIEIRANRDNVVHRDDHCCKLVNPQRNIWNWSSGLC